MKFVGVIIGSLQIFEVYPPPNLISTAIGVSLLMLLSWIRILVNHQQKQHRHLIVSHILLFHPELYSELCTIEVDLSHLSNTSNVQTLKKPSGAVYYKVAYELIMLFGGTEIEVQLCWKENVRS